MAATRAGDDRAFERLYERYQRRIAAYVRGMVKDHGRAEDITQEVFISALRRIRETDRSIIFKPWVYEIAKNACIDAFRRSRRAEEISYDADGGLGPADHGRLVSSTPTPDAAVDTRMSLDHLRGAFGGLSETHHDILVMRELEGLSYREIGQRLGMSRPSVESTLFRARRRLTEEYEELTSGERCVRVQRLIADADGGRMGMRQERQLARHVSHCQPCRRAAYAAGLDVAALAERRSLRSKIAALLPLPAFVRRWFRGGSGDGGHGSGAGGGAFARWSTTASQYAEPAGGWVKAAAVAATVAAAGVGTGVGVTQGTSKPDAGGQAPVAAPAGGSSAGSGSTSGGAATGVRTAKSVGAAGSSTHTGAGAARPGAARPGSSTSSAPAPDGGGSAGAGDRTGSGGGSTGGRSDAGAGGGTADRAAGTVERAADTARNTVDGAKNSVSTTTKTATDTVSKTVRDTTETATGAVGKTVRDTTDKVDKATGNATAPVTGAVNDAVDTATGAVNTATGAVNTATGTAGGSVPSDPVGTVTNSLPNVSTPSVSVPTPSVSVPTATVSVPPSLPGPPGG